MRVLAWAQANPFAFFASYISSIGTMWYSACVP